MNDKQMAALIMSELLPRMQVLPGLSDVALARKYQPRQHGAASGAIVYFFKVGDHNHGAPRRSETLNGSAFDQALQQLVESTYQFTAWVPQPAELTESDVLHAVSAIMQSDTMLAAFRAAGVGVQRVVDVRNPYFVDERDRFEAEPSLDIVLTHYRILPSALPAVDAFEANTQRV